MTLNEYQKWCVSIWSTRRPVSKKGKRTYTLRDNYVMTLGLAGEGAEVVDAMLKLLVSIGKVTERSKKDLRDTRKTDKKEAIKELGDVEYYLSVVADRLGITMQEVLDANVKKLTKRFAKKKYARKPR